MNKYRWTKGVVLCILLMTIGASVFPTLPGAIHQVNESAYSQETAAIQTQQSCASSQMMDDVLVTSGTVVYPNGLFTKNLGVDAWNQQFGEQRLLQPLDDAFFLQPLNNDIFKAGNLVAITGTADGATFQNYTIEWGIGPNPSQWFSTGIILVNGGQTPIVNGSLATWDTSFVTVGNFYTLKLVVNFVGYYKDAFVKNLYVDPTLKEGWPVKIPYEYNTGGGFYYWVGFIEPVVDDLNKDGYQEIVVFKGGNPPKLDAFRVNGSLLWESPIGNTDVSGGNLHIPVVDDINNDGYDEIVVFRFISTQSTSQVYVFDHDGAVLDGWPIQIYKEYHPALLIADVNADGYKEIIFKGNSGTPDRKLLIINSTGTILAQWSLSLKSWGASIEGSPAVGNFDDDPELEIVCADPSEHAGYNASSGEWINEGVIHVYNLDGSEVSGWPKYTDGIIFSSPVTGDIDQDGATEIVVGLEYAGSAPDYRYGGVYAYDKYGNVLPGFPFEKGWNFASTPALADFDKDGDLEIAVSRLGFYTYVLHHNGTLASGWPQTTTWNDYYSTIVGDINNDNIPDIITTAGNGFYPSIYHYGGVEAWNYNGTPIPGFPKVTDSDAQAPVTIADIDNDGKVEIIGSSDWDYDWQTSLYKYRGSLYVWEIDAAYHQATMEWPTFHHDLQRTGMYLPSSLTLLEIGNITGGFLKVKTSVKNTGEAVVSNIQWNITVTGRFVLLGKKTNGSIPALNASEEQTIRSKLLFGFGKAVVKIVVTAPGTKASKERNATLWMFFIRMK